MLDQDTAHLVENQEDHQQHQLDLAQPHLAQKIWDKLKKYNITGFILAALACFSMTAAGIIVKVLDNVDPFVLTGYRNCVIFLCSSIRLIVFKIDPEPIGKRKLLIMRGLFLTIYSSGLYYSFRYLPLGDVRTLTAAQPVFVTLCACIFLGESCGIFDVLALISTATGMILVTHPPFIFGDKILQSYDYHYYIAAGMAVVSTICQAFGFVITRSIKHLDFAVITAWMGLFGFLPPILVSIALGTFGLPSAKDTPYVILVGILSFLGQSLMTLALKVQEAGTVALIRKADDILLAFIIQILYFHNTPDYLAIIGSVIITITVILTGLRKIFDTRIRSPSIRLLLCLLPLNTVDSSTAENEQ